MASKEAEINSEEAYFENDEKTEKPVDQDRKRRRTGWDQSTRVLVPSSSSSSSAIPPVPVNAPVAMQLPLISAPKTGLQSTAAEIAAKLAFQQQLLAKTSLINLVAPTVKPGCRIYVGSLHYELGENEIIALFSAFGKVTKCELGREPSGRSRGYCFLEFDEPASAEAALSMDGFTVANRKIKVGRPAHGNGSISATPAISSNTLLLNQLANSIIPQTVSAAVPPPLPVPVTTEQNFVTVSNVKINIGISDVQDLFTLYGGIKTVKKLSSRKMDPTEFYDVLLEYNEASAASTAARTMNGHNLAGTKLIVETISLQDAIQLMIQKVEQAVLTTVLLEDMLTTEDLEDPDLEGEILDEAKKYGNVTTLKINKEGAKPSVRVNYQEANDAVKAQKSLNGRSFAGRKIKASLVP